MKHIRCTDLGYGCKSGPAAIILKQILKRKEGACSVFVKLKFKILVCLSKTKVFL